MLGAETAIELPSEALRITKIPLRIARTITVAVRDQ